MWIINLITNLIIYIFFNIKIQSVTLFFLTWRSSKNKRINRGSRAQVLAEVEIRTTSKTDQQPSNNPEAITTVRSNRIQNHSVEKTEEKGRKRVQDSTTEKGTQTESLLFHYSYAHFVSRIWASRSSDSYSTLSLSLS